jgi:phosphate transport system substrate-binding protein
VAVKEQNSGLALPDLPIVPIHRTDPAGATLLFSTYLCRVSESWVAGPRAGTSIQWPAAVGAAADGLDGQVAKVKATQGAISFAGETTVKESKFPTASLLNHAGEFVKANVASFNRAAEAADWEAPAFNMDLVDLDAKGAWPIVGANFVLVPDNPAAGKVEVLRNTFKFFEWAFKNGAAAANDLELPEVPESAHRHIHEVWRRAKDPSGRPIGEA